MIYLSRHALIPFLLAVEFLGGYALAAENHALLIGCSQYSDDSIRDLAGAENDVRSFEELLRTQFGFKNITTLAGWPADASKRPTHDNIVAAFEQLIEAVGPGSQVVILMSGHGFRVPLPESQVDLLDPSNPEPDGFDEAFAPADYQAGKNMILDNQIGQWLDRLKEKGAHVWIVFDCCFSGTMSRGDDTEIARELAATEAGISLDAIRKADERARAAQMANRGSSSPASEGFDLSRKQGQQGSVVAFYAAQEFETAPEVSRPHGVPAGDPRFKRGLLSYTLEQELRQRTKKVTYRDLGRALVSRYRADGRRRPTPSWDGDIDREVLGQEEWPAATAIHLEHVGDQTRLTGGQLAGLRKDTIVAAYRLEDKEFSQPLGYLKVTETTATAALVQPVAYNGIDAPKLNALPDNSVCRIVSQDLGDTRIRLRLMSIHDQVTDLDKALSQSIAKLAVDQDAFVEVVPDLQSAEWVYAQLTPSAAARQLGDDTSEPIGILLPAEDASVLLQSVKQEDECPNERLRRIPHARFTGDTVTDPDACAKRLLEELRKVHVWKNFWQVASAYSENSPLIADSDISLEVRLLKGPDDHSAGEPPAASRLANGDYITVRVANTGYHAYWYSVFYLDTRCGIYHVATDAIQGRDFQNPYETRVEKPVRRFRINKNMYGTNGFILVAVRQREHSVQPNYQFLAQAPLGQSATRASIDTHALSTPFEQLLLNTLGGGPQRLRSSQSPDEPRISAWSWVTE